MSYTGIHHVLVRLQGRYNEQITTENGLQLYRGGSRGTEAEFIYAHEDNICGEVVGTCVKSGKKLIGGTNRGLPKYVSGSNDSIPSKAYYKCTPYKDEGITTQGNPTEVQEGDLVYFQRGAIKDDNFIDRETDGSLLLLVEYSNLFLRIRNGKTEMLGMYCQAEKYFGEDIEDHDGIKGRKLTYGSLELIIPTDGRKIQHGKVLSIGKGISDMPKPEVEAGDIIIYEPKAEFENEIEGKLVYIFYTGDLMAKLVGNEIIPIGDYVTITPDKPKSDSHIFIPQSVLDKQKVSIGEVTGVGSFVSNILIGDKVHYGASTTFEGQSEILVNHKQIMLRYEN
jgi:co-chaperonin GroES (HSP10)